MNQNKVIIILAIIVIALGIFGYGDKDVRFSNGGNCGVYSSMDSDFLSDVVGNFYSVVANLENQIAEKENELSNLEDASEYGLGQQTVGQISQLNSEISALQTSLDSAYDNYIQAFDCLQALLEEEGAVSSTEEEDFEIPNPVPEPEPEYEEGPLELPYPEEELEEECSINSDCESHGENYICNDNVCEEDLSFDPTEGKDPFDFDDPLSQ